MAAPDGYKIYWGTTKDSIDGVHPTNSAYNSPFVVNANIGEYTLPVDFWSNTFSAIYFRVAAFKGTDEGVKSTPTGLFKFVKDVTQPGLGSYSLPLDDGNTYKAKNLGLAVGATVVYVFDKTQNKFVATITVLPLLGPDITKQTGVFLNFSTTGQRAWIGRGWKD